jgi:hypothetical protein
MKYPEAEKLAQSYGATHWLIHQHVDGLDHPASLIQPPFQANCLNWVVGHILVSRHTVLRLLGAEPVWGQETITRYKTGSEPITEDGQGLPLAQLVTDLDQVQERIVAALAEVTPDALAEEAETDRGVRSVGEHIYGLHWHETYHTGQLELLRALADSA